MAFDLLYGPKIEGADYVVSLRSLVLDIEVVETIHALMQDGLNEQDEKWEAQQRELAEQRGLALSELSGGPMRPATRFPVEVRLHDPVGLGLGRVIPLESVQGRLKADRERLALSGGGVNILFFRGRRPYVMVDGTLDRFDASFPIAQARAQEIADLLSRNGSSRLRLYNWHAYLPALGGMIAVGSLLWMLASSDVTAAQAVFATVMAVGVLIGGVAWSGALLKAYPESHPGIRFREASRADARVQLARVKASALVTVIAAPAGAILTLIVQAVAGVGPFA
jgi:hypothetical protein